MRCIWTAGAAARIDQKSRALGSDASSVQTAGTGAAQSIQVRSKSLDTAAVAKLKSALFDKLQPKGTNGTPSQQVISDSAVSGSWGGEITRQALIALVVFLVLVTLFLTFYFERAMAGAARGAALAAVGKADRPRTTAAMRKSGWTRW